MARHKSYSPDDVKDLRGELLRAGLAIMQNKAEVKRWSAIKKEYVLKVGSRVLPVLNAGRDDSEQLFPIPILAGKTKSAFNGVPRNHGNSEIAETEKENS